MEYIKPLWNYADCGYWNFENDIYSISTGGWSGNEDIIANMQENIVWWMMHWQSSRRGGHYTFEDIQRGNCELPDISTYIYNRFRMNTLFEQARNNLIGGY